jgi:hypothetical protein
MDLILEDVSQVSQSQSTIKHEPGSGKAVGRRGGRPAWHFLQRVSCHEPNAAGACRGVPVIVVDAGDFGGLH